MGVLTVVLDKIDHLRDKDGIGKFWLSCECVKRRGKHDTNMAVGRSSVSSRDAGKSDPYVSFYLEQVCLVVWTGLRRTS